MTANPLDEMIAIALGGQRCTHYEVLPEDFGPEGGRWLLLQKCLEVLSARYPLLSLELSGSLEALRKFGLAPARSVAVGDMSVAVRFGRTERLGVVRVQFSRAPFLSRRVATARQPAVAGRD
jgi:hypothetical protein